MQWVLVISLISPSNQFLDKIAVPMPTEAVCIESKRQLQGSDRVKPIGICVTMDHWTGKKIMPGVYLD